MIEYLKVEIIPISFAGTDAKELRIKIESSGNPPYEKRQLIEPDELISVFDQIWERAGKEFLKFLKDETPSPIPTGVPQRP